MLDKIKIIATSCNAFRHWALFVIKNENKIRLNSVQCGKMDFTVIYHIYRHCDFMFELEHLALKLGMNFFPLPFDAVNIYSVTMISEYVCSCDNIILKKRKTCKAWQWSREMTKNNMKYELKQKKSYWKLIQTQQEFLVKIISFSPIWH